MCRYCGSFENPNNKLIFEQKYDELLKVDKKMGITEIVMKQERAEGRQEAWTEAQEIIRKDRKNTVLSMRKIGFSAEKIADVLGYSLSDRRAHV